MTAPRSQPVQPAVAYLGPEGTFTELAAEQLTGTGTRRVPCATVAAAFSLVRTAAAAAAVVPLENSVEGGVSATLAEFAKGDPVSITAETLVSVRFALLARPGASLGWVRKVGTHPHAASQCRRWLDGRLPHAQVVATSSTAAAAAAVARGDAGLDAAVAAPWVADRYGLTVLAEPVGDRSGAVTRFVRVEPPGATPPRTGTDTTSLLVFIRDDHPGALADLLAAFSSRSVNLTRIESRPTGEGLGKYCFFIDASGHVEDEAVASSLADLRRTGATVRLLGSYPRNVPGGST